MRRQPRQMRHPRPCDMQKVPYPLNGTTGGIKGRKIFFSLDLENAVCCCGPFGNWLLSDTDFVGASSTTHLAKRLNPSSTNLAWDVRPLYDDPSSLQRTVSSALPQLPPFEFAKRLFWVQYMYIGTIFSLINPREFEDRLDFVYHQPPDFSHRETCLVYCQVLLVISFGLMYSVNQWSGEDGPPGFKYFKHALRFLPDIHEEGSIFFVEVLCYVAYYMQNLNRRDAAFLYVWFTSYLDLSITADTARSASPFAWPSPWGFTKRYRTRALAKQTRIADAEHGGRCTVWTGSVSVLFTGVSPR